ncbi:hypothetical protein NCAS_0B00640 [Naumovozyma castellii]|uniref:Thioredoxin domain-containing protein n=1 Tax=Naumovozyma castellii TaxID=27288 RepID=G0VB25_NAUCA|nr:hypothetical protein NCAS_0B00640 [Naumovozyma castellii CBS 4309]CCC68148.1 hypothetical protein NCAS_0B00640 [Naumovozyma castellii CBS 4309]
MKLLVLLICVFQAFVHCQNFYDADPNIIELTPANFDKVVHRTNYTTLIEFYAPWCGYCKQLKGTIHKAARKLKGVVQVATVNCDLEQNKQLCGQYGIEGFPTLKIFKPPRVNLKKRGPTRFKTHADELYNGQRNLAPIVDFALSRIKTYVKKLGRVDKLQNVLDNSTRPSVVLFSKKGPISPIYKSIAIDWLGQVDLYTMPNVKMETLNNLDAFSQSYPKIATFLESFVKTQSSNDKSRLVVFNGVDDTYFEFDGESITKKDVAQFLTNSLNITPKEGPLSSREAYLETLRSGKKKKKNTKKSKSSSSSRKRDEL